MLVKVGNLFHLLGLFLSESTKLGAKRVVRAALRLQGRFLLN